MLKIFALLLASYLVLSAMLRNWSDRYLHLVTCDVGQGDAILLEWGTLQVLIDTGPDEEVLNCLQDQLPFWDKKIDVLILTHFDEDHIGGFTALTQIYAIGYLFLPLTNFQESQVFLELKKQISALQSQGTQVKEPFLGQQIAFSQVSFDFQAKYNSVEVAENENLPSFLLTFITPSHLDLAEYRALDRQGSLFWQRPEDYLSAEDWQTLAYKQSDNDGSIAVFVQFGQLKLLLLGDLESARELALISDGLITSVDVQKVGHHGSKTASSLALLEKTRPEIALISAGQNNKFSHPHQEVLDRFERLGALILRTDQLGSIKLLSDGQNFWIKEQKISLF